MKLLSDWRVLTGITVLLWAGYSVALKYIAPRIASASSLFYFVAGYFLVTLVYCLAAEKPKTVFAAKPEAGIALLAGFACALGAVAFFRALAAAPGSLVLPIAGLYSVAAAAGCVILLHEPLTPRLAAGLAAAAVAVILLGKA